MNALDSADRVHALKGAIADCVAGRQDGLHQILALEGPQLLGVARRMLKRADLAEEALQDALLQVWRKADQFRADTGSARGWIYAILRNRCLNILRDGKRLSLLPPQDLEAMQEERQQIVADDGWQMLSGSDRLEACLKELDLQNRKAILLAYVGGYSHGEIAGRLNTPLGTVKSWIRRGLGALRECLS